VLADRYALGEVIGRGGMAEVYKAEDQLLQRSVAIKVLREMPETNHDARFQAEVRTLASLGHPNLVTVLDAGTSDQGPFLVMELVEGSSMAAHRGIKMDPERVAAIGRDLADALAYVHRRGIVHRDVKPANILLDREGRVRLTDFGIARMLHEATRHTATGTTVGTAAFLSPEQVRGVEVSPAADIYALGLVLLEALTGERMYEGAPIEAAMARLHRPPAVPDWLPTSWQDLLVSMTQMEPDARATAFEVTQRLGILADGEQEPATSTPDPQWTRAARTAPTAAPSRPRMQPVQHGHRSHRAAGPRSSGTSRSRRALASLGVAVLVVGGVLWAFHSGQQSGSEAPTRVPTQLQQPLQDLHDAVDG
jgi:serine/threonine protein kinase